MAGGKPVPAPRYVCWIALDEAPGKRKHTHSCGNDQCVNPRHLSWTQPGPMPPMAQAAVIKGLDDTGRNSSSLIETEPPPIKGLDLTMGNSHSLIRAVEALAEIKGLDTKGGIYPFGLVETAPPPFVFSDAEAALMARLVAEPEPVDEGRNSSFIEPVDEVENSPFICSEPEPDTVVGNSYYGSEPEPALRLAAIMADPILHDPYWFGMPTRPAPEPILSDDQWASTLEQEARCRRTARLRPGPCQQGGLAQAPVTHPADRRSRCEDIG
jgi:hypothetical protein